MTDPAAQLATLGGLAGIDEATLGDLLSMFERRVYDGVEICRQGDSADRLWVLTHGTVRVVRTTAERLPVEVAQLQPTTLVGFSGLIGITSRSASLRAKGPVELWEMRTEDAITVLEQEASHVGSALRRAIIAAVSRQLRSANTNIAKLAVEGGLARRIVSEEHLLAANTLF
jgi:CRP-like cAMP-binding protein